VEQGDQRISISEERLKRNLAEMELRLRVYFDERINDIRETKASATDLALLAVKVDALDRGDFTDVHRRALTEFIEEHGAQQEGRIWTRNERWFGAIGIFIAVVMATVSIYFGLQATATREDAPPPAALVVAREVA
jgi:hypothetical protein